MNHPAKNHSGHPVAAPPDLSSLHVQATTGTPSVWHRMLATIHGTVLDRIGGRPERVSTAGEIPLADLTVVGPNRAHGRGYRPTPRMVVRWALDLLPEPVDPFVFIDLGSGRGRVVMEAARRPFRRILGVEFAEALHEDAEANLRHWPRSLMKCREVDLMLKDAATAPLPEDDLVVYIYDTFAPALMTRMAARLAEHGRKYRVYVILVDPEENVALRESRAFRRIDVRSRARSLRWFSPLPAQLYTVIPAQD